MSKADVEYSKEETYRIKIGKKERVMALVKRDQKPQTLLLFTGSNNLLDDVTIDELISGLKEVKEIMEANK